MKDLRTSSSFLIKQRPFIQLYVLKFLEDGRPYGIQMLEQLRERFKKEGYQPNHAEIYRALHDLVDSGVLKASKKKLSADSYQEITTYFIRDVQKAIHLKKQLINELNRSKAMLMKALEDIED